MKLRELGVWQRVGAGVVALIGVVASTFAFWFGLVAWGFIAPVVGVMFGLVGLAMAFGCGAISWVIADRRVSRWWVLVIPLTSCLILWAFTAVYW